MRPLDELSQQKIDERRREVAEGKRFDSRDLLSLMRGCSLIWSKNGELMAVRANMSPDVTPEWKLYDSEISGQLATFVFAGSDTTS